MDPNQADSRRHLAPNFLLRLITHFLYLIDVEIDLEADPSLNGSYLILARWGAVHLSFRLVSITMPEPLDMAPWPARPHIGIEGINNILEGDISLPHPLFGHTRTILQRRSQVAADALQRFITDHPRVGPYARPPTASGTASSASSITTTVRATPPATPHRSTSAEQGENTGLTQADQADIAELFGSPYEE